MGKLGAVVEKKIMPVETDANKLVNFVCGSNINIKGEDVKVRSTLDRYTSVMMTKKKLSAEAGQRISRLAVELTHGTTKEARRARPGDEGILEEASVDGAATQQPTAEDQKVLKRKLATRRLS